MFEGVKRFFGFGREATPSASASASPLPQARIGIFGIDLDQVREHLAAESAGSGSKDSTTMRHEPRSDSYLSAAALNRLRPLLAKVKPGIACEEIKDSHVGTALAQEHSNFRAHQEFIANIDSLMLRGERIRDTARGFFTDSVNAAISDETYDAEAWSKKLKMYNSNSKTQNEQTQNLWVDLTSEVREFKARIDKLWKQGELLGETITADMRSPLAPDLNINVSRDEDIETLFEKFVTSFDPMSEQTLKNLERMKGGIEPMLEPVIKGLENLSEMRERQQALQDEVIAKARRSHSL